MATRRDFCQLGVDREAQFPLFPKDCEVWTLPDGPVQTSGKLHWHMEFVLGPNAGWPQATAAQCAPPVLRKASVGELMAALAARGQVGFPSAMNSDASLGPSRMVSRCAKIAFSSRDAHGCMGGRLVGAASRRH